VRKTVFRLLLPVMAVLGLLVSGGGVASAQAGGFTAQAIVPWPPDCDHEMRSYDLGAMVCFNPTGEHMYVCDVEADGHHPAARYQGSNDPGFSYKHHSGPGSGVGTCLDVDFDMPEDTFIRYAAYNYEGDTLVSSGQLSGWIPAKG
jgi:hypothetical protein